MDNLHEYKGKDTEKEGGIVEGKLHSECDDKGCGEKYELDNGKVIEVEADEAVIPDETFATNDVFKIIGTPSQIASALSVIGNGKNFDSGASIFNVSKGKRFDYSKKEHSNTDVAKIETRSYVINRRSMADSTKYTVEGTTLQIASAINSLNNNGKSTARGAIMIDAKTGEIPVFKDGGGVELVSIGENISVPQKELDLGIETEMEHAETIRKFMKPNTKIEEVAMSITIDHLKENPEYYKKLKEMESTFKDGGLVTYYPLTIQINDYLQANGINTRTVISNTDFGHSDYIYANLDKSVIPTDGVAVKFRISDHSVSNIDRMRNEIHYNSTVIADENILNNALNEVYFALDRSNYFDHEIIERKECKEVITKTPNLDNESIISEETTSTGKTMYKVQRCYSKRYHLYKSKLTGQNFEIFPVDEIAEKNKEIELKRQSLLNEIENDTEFQHWKKQILEGKTIKNSGRTYLSLEDFKAKDSQREYVYQINLYGGAFSYYYIYPTDGYPSNVDYNLVYYLDFLRKNVMPNKFDNGGDVNKSQNTNHYNENELEKITFTKKITRYEIEHILSRDGGNRNEELIKTIASHLRASKSASGETKESKQYKQQEEKSLIEYISNNNLWFNNYLDYNYIGEGAEQKVYLIDGVSVIKLNNSIFYSSWEDYLTSILIHNLFFPPTSYELIGFTYYDNHLNAVVKQNFIESDEDTDLDSLKIYMLNNGFLNRKNNDYYSPTLGVVLEDLHDENVLTKNGAFYFIDTVFYLFETESEEKHKKEDSAYLSEVNDFIIKATKSLKESCDCDENYFSFGNLSGTEDAKYFDVEVRFSDDKIFDKKNSKALRILVENNLTIKLIIDSSKVISEEKLRKILGYINVHKVIGKKNTFVIGTLKYNLSKADYGLTPSQSNYVRKDEIYSIQKQQLEKLLNEFKKHGIHNFTVSTSYSNGESIYIEILGYKLEKVGKIRISDHSVTNSSRIKNEIHGIKYMGDIISLSKKFEDDYEKYLHENNLVNNELRDNKIYEIKTYYPNLKTN